jgi:glycine reductase
MDLSTQETIKRLAEQHGADSLLVLLGAPDAESAGIAAETVVLGDPSWAGPLAGVQLGLPVYHILEDELRAAIPAEVWEEQVGLMADVLDVEAITQAVREFREQAAPERSHG